MNWDWIKLLIEGIRDFLIALGAFQAGQKNAETKQTEKALEVARKQLEIANEPPASVDAVADWLSGDEASDRKPKS